MKYFSMKRALVEAVLLIVVAAITWIATSDRIEGWHIRRTCSDAETSQQCITAALASRLSRDGDIGQILSLARYVYGTKDFATNCSPLMSRLGSKAYHDHYEILWNADTVHCNYAFMQSYVREMTLVNRAPKEMADFCVNITRKISDVSGVRAECYRGIGQSLPFIREDRTTKPDVMIAYAIEQCESLVEEPVSRKLCVSGAFQYLDIAEANDLHGLSVETPHPLGICERQQESYRAICAESMKRVLLKGFETGTGGFANVLSTIQSHNEHVGTETLEVLAHTLGFDRASLLQPNPNLNNLVQECADLDATIQLSCVRGVVLGMAKNAPADLQIKEIREFCALVGRELNPDIAKQCLSEASVDFLLGTLDSNRVRPLCSEFGAAACERKMLR